MAKSRLKVSSVVKVLYVGPIPIPRQIGDNFTFRVEILRDVNSARAYFAKMWRIEHYRIEPSFPKGKRGTNYVADEGILVEDVSLDTDLKGNSVADVQRKALGRISEVFQDGPDRE